MMNPDKKNGIINQNSIEDDDNEEISEVTNQMVADYYEDKNDLAMDDNDDMIGDDDIDKKDEKNITEKKISDIKRTIASLGTDSTSIVQYQKKVSQEFNSILTRIINSYKESTKNKEKAKISSVLIERLTRIISDEQRIVTGDNQDLFFTLFILHIKNFVLLFLKEILGIKDNDLNKIGSIKQLINLVIYSIKNNSSFEIYSPAEFEKKSELSRFRQPAITIKPAEKDGMMQDIHYFCTALINVTKDINTAIDAGKVLPIQIDKSLQNSATSFLIKNYNEQEKESILKNISNMLTQNSVIYTDIQLYFPEIESKIKNNSNEVDYFNLFFNYILEIVHDQSIFIIQEKNRKNEYINIGTSPTYNEINDFINVFFAKIKVIFSDIFNNFYSNKEDYDFNKITIKIDNFKWIESIKQKIEAIKNNNIVNYNMLNSAFKKNISTPDNEKWFDLFELILGYDFNENIVSFLTLIHNFFEEKNGTIFIRKPEKTKEQYLNLKKEIEQYSQALKSEVETKEEQIKKAGVIDEKEIDQLIKKKIEKLEPEKINEDIYSLSVSDLKISTPIVKNVKHPALLILEYIKKNFIPSDNAQSIAIGSLAFNLAKEIRSMAIKNTTNSKLKFFSSIFDGINNILSKEYKVEYNTDIPLIMPEWALDDTAKKIRIIAETIEDSAKETSLTEEETRNLVDLLYNDLERDTEKIEKIKHIFAEFKSKLMAVGTKQDFIDFMLNVTKEIDNLRKTNINTAKIFKGFVKEAIYGFLERIKRDIENRTLYSQIFSFLYQNENYKEYAPYLQLEKIIESLRDKKKLDRTAKKLIAIEIGKYFKNRWHLIEREKQTVILKTVNKLLQNEDIEESDILALYDQESEKKNIFYDNDPAGKKRYGVTNSAVNEYLGVDGLLSKTGGITKTLFDIKKEYELRTSKKLRSFRYSDVYKYVLETLIGVPYSNKKDTKETETFEHEKEKFLAKIFDYFYLNKTEIEIPESFKQINIVLPPSFVGLNEDTKQEIRNAFIKMPIFQFFKMPLFTPVLVEKMNQLLRKRILGYENNDDKKNIFNQEFKINPQKQQNNIYSKRIVSTLIYHFIFNKGLNLTDYTKNILSKLLKNLNITSLYYSDNSINSFYLKDIISVAIINYLYICGITNFKPIQNYIDKKTILIGGTISSSIKFVSQIINWYKDRKN